MRLLRLAWQTLADEEHVVELIDPPDLKMATAQGKKSEPEERRASAHHMNNMGLHTERLIREMQDKARC